MLVRQAQFAAFDRDIRRRLAESVLEDVRTSAPHAVNGLSKKEVDERLETAVDKTERYRLDSPEDLKAFVRLCFIVGPNFDQYPPFNETLLQGGARTGRPMLELFDSAGQDDWNKAAQRDIVSRYRKPPPDERSSQEQPEFSAGSFVSLTALESRYAQPYFLHALHPDVWRLAGMKPPTTLEDVQGFMAERNRTHGASYAIIGGREEFLGAIFVSAQDAAWQISYWIVRPLWGKGIATRALQLLTDALRAQDETPIRLSVQPGNLPSIKVAEKCGFQRTNSPGSFLIFEA